MCAARPASCFPASVSASRREVRLKSRVPSRVSTRLTASETVALESFSATAAAANERISATLAKIARPSKSGRLAISKPETISFHSFYFQLNELSIPLVAKRAISPGEAVNDRTQTLQPARRREPRLAARQAPFLLCRLP